MNMVTGFSCHKMWEISWPVDRLLATEARSSLELVISSWVYLYVSFNAVLKPNISYVWLPPLICTWENLIQIKFQRPNILSTSCSCSWQMLKYSLKIYEEHIVLLLYQFIICIRFMCLVESNCRGDCGHLHSWHPICQSTSHIHRYWNIPPSSVVQIPSLSNM
jgi:hypothetical protein